MTVVRGHPDNHHLPEWAREGMILVYKGEHYYHEKRFRLGYRYGALRLMTLSGENSYQGDKAGGPHMWMKDDGSEGNRRYAGWIRRMEKA